MNKLKLALKLGLLIELLVGTGLILNDGINCRGDCFAGLNNTVVIVLPAMLGTAILYLAVKALGSKRK
jgi:hypothetical protein